MNEKRSIGIGLGTFFGILFLFLAAEQITPLAWGCICLLALLSFLDEARIGDVGFGLGWVFCVAGASIGYLLWQPYGALIGIVATYLLTAPIVNRIQDHYDQKK